MSQMANVLALKNAQQKNQMNQLALTESERGAEETQQMRNYLAGVEDVNTPDVRRQLMTKFGLKGVEYSKALSERDKSAADLSSSRFNLIKSKTDYFKDQLPNITTPQEAQIWTAAVYSDPDVGPTLSKFGGNLEQAVSKVPTDPAALMQWKQQAAMGAGKFLELVKPVAVGTSQRLVDPTTGRVIMDATAESKPIALGVNQRLVDPETRQVIVPAVAGSGSAEPPKLRPGERWRPDTQTVEAVPGSDIFKKQKSDFTKEYKAATSVIDKMEEGVKKLDSLLDPKKAKGFSYNFGGYTEKFAGQFLPGAATDFRKELDSFKSTLKSAGLELIRQGGSIGQMTVQEWPIVEQMIAAISPEMGEEAAKATMNEIRARFDRIASRAREIYDLEYADSQFYTPIKGGGAVSRPTSPGAPNVDALLEKYK
jgi:hypothetical protein